MPQETQKKEPADKLTNVRRDDSWVEDQEKREYYYDDAHGYEVFVPEEEDAPLQDQRIAPNLMQNRSVKRRKDRRFADPVRVVVFWSGNNGRHEGYISDIGMGGCFLNTNTTANDGDKISLEIPSPQSSDKIFDVNGTVIPQTRNLKGFGVRFSALNHTQQGLMARLIVEANEPGDRRG